MSGGAKVGYLGTMENYRFKKSGQKPKELTDYQSVTYQGRSFHGSRVNDRLLMEPEFGIITKIDSVVFLPV